LSINKSFFIKSTLLAVISAHFYFEKDYFCPREVRTRDLLIWVVFFRGPSVQGAYVRQSATHEVAFGRLKKLSELIRRTRRHAIQSIQ